MTHQFLKLVELAYTLDLDPVPLRQGSSPLSRTNFKLWRLFILRPSGTLGAPRGSSFVNFVAGVAEAELCSLRSRDRAQEKISPDQVEIEENFQSRWKKPGRDEVKADIKGFRKDGYRKSSRCTWAGAIMAETLERMIPGVIEAVVKYELDLISEPSVRSAISKPGASGADSFSRPCQRLSCPNWKALKCPGRTSRSHQA